MTSYNHLPNQRIVEVSEAFTIKAAAKDVFAKICEPCSLLQWHDGLATCESTTDQGRLARTYVMKSTPGVHPVEMYEIELLRSEKIMTITYEVDVKNLPLTDYHAQITVTPLNEEYCRARIRSRFVRIELGVPSDPDMPYLEARDIVSDFYIAGLAKLSEIMRT